MLQTDVGAANLTVASTAAVDHGFWSALPRNGYLIAGFFAVGSVIDIVKGQPEWGFLLLMLAAVVLVAWLVHRGKGLVVPRSKGQRLWPTAILVVGSLALLGNLSSASNYGSASAGSSTNERATSTGAATTTVPPTTAPTESPTPKPERAQAEYVDPRLLSSDPHGYVGRNVFLQGEALNVEQRAASSGGLFSQAHPAYTWIQLMAQVRGKDAFSTESIVVEMVPQVRTLLKDECYRVYGVVTGTQRVRVLLTGAERDAPVVSGYAYEQAQSGSYNLGCASP